MELDFLENETLNEEILLHVLLLFRLYGRWPVYIRSRKKGLACIEREREENLEMEIKLELREILVGEGWGKRGIKAERNSM